MKNLNVCFVTLGLEFSGDTLSTEGLGGSETALICMARETAKLGHRVSVFCNTREPGTYDGVSYYPHPQFGKVSSVTTWDVLIASRWPEFLTAPGKAGLRILWLHDMPTDASRIMGQIWQTDQLFMLSDFHIESYTEFDDPDCEEEKKRKIPDLKQHIWKTSNGVDLELIEKHRKEKVPGKLIYTSRPERGLLHLLRDVMPKLIAENPEVKLHYCNYSLQGMQVPEHVAQLNVACEQLAASMPNNVVKLGHLPKHKLYEEMSSAQLLLYPTEFPEISCITAMEAAACGTPIVSTNAFALQETVAHGKTGFLIDGLPSDGDPYFSKFIRKTRFLLNNKSVYDRMSKAGPAFVKERGYTWDAVAASWEARFVELLTNRYEENKASVCKELHRNSDLIRALEVAEETGDPDILAHVKEDIEDAQIVRKVVLDTDVTDTFKEAMARFRKMGMFMQVRGCDPKLVWDYGCGDSAFSLFMAKASPKCQTYAIDRNEDVIRRVGVYAEKSQLTNIHTIQADSLASVAVEEPDFLFLGNVLDTIEKPWEFVSQAAKHVAPGGMIGFTVRFGAEQAGLPEEHTRIWNFDQDDFYEMFGNNNVHLTMHKRGESDAGDVYGDWLCLVPVENKELETQPLTATRTKFVTRPYQSIAACVIAKDAEDWILRFAKPVLKVVDKLYITLDESTTDNTERLLGMLDHQHKIEIRHNKFDNFAAQRNFSKEDVEEDWILWIDTDEVLVGGEKIRKHLHSPIMEGFSIRQNHLMLDVHGTSDLPVRLLRNREHYKFVGCIHEHCEDTSKEGYDNPIKPAMVLTTVDLAHYGYLNEPQRRAKCSNRNMELLVRDLKENPDRQLNKVLAVRDYLNIVKWQVDRDNLQKTGIQPGSQPHAMLEAAIGMYHRFLADPKARYHDIAEPMYQEALAILAVNGLCYRDKKNPPFSVALGLSGAVGGPAKEDVRNKLAWFLDEVEYAEFMARQSSTLIKKLGIADAEAIDEALSQPSKVEFDYDDDGIDLLARGVGVIDKTGQMTR